MLGEWNARIAVLVPCFNEEKTVGSVVRAFRENLPDATVYVYDNNSTDRTATVAAEAGAVVRRELRQGKGNVVRRMLADVDADLLIMVDGDATYDASAAPGAVQLALREGLDFINIARDEVGDGAYRPAHRFGNRALTGIVRFFFGTAFSDMLSGYKVLSRRFAKSFPIASTGFEIETELTIHCLELRMPAAEISAPYGSRPEGSFSKLKTIPDGIRIVALITRLLKDERPLMFFGAVAALLVSLGMGLGVPVIAEYLETGLVPRFPTALLSASLMVLAAIAATAGIVLDLVTKSRREVKNLFYLQASR